MYQRVLMSVLVAAALTVGYVSPASAQVPIRVGGDIKEPRKLKDVKPAYPEAAQRDRIQGIVIIEAVINPEGKVQDVRVIRGVDALDQAALDAVQQWEYTPTLLNGQPVPVIMTVTVSFSLAGAGQPPATTSGSSDVAAMIDYAKAVHARGLYSEAESALQRALALLRAERARSIAPAAAGAPTPLRVGSSVKEPARLTYVAPEFPAGTPAGVSVMEIVIGADGRVTDAQVLRGISADADASMVAAVRQWTYEPTMLNGVAVPVVMTVTVTRHVK